MFSKKSIVLLAGVLGLSSCKPQGSPPSDIGPAKWCAWDYVKKGPNGVVPRFKTAYTDAGFDKKFNPIVHVSRIGLTGRVVGTLSDDFMRQYNNDMSRVVQDFPNFVPVRQTAIHHVSGSNLKGSEVIDLPANSVMVVYPVSIGVGNPGTDVSTEPGEFVVWYTERSKTPSAAHPEYAWGWFPYIAYDGGVAMHGPITRSDSLWYLRRGPVSHGCNRMEGEHIVELGVLLGCNADGTKGCPDPKTETTDDLRVTVMHEFDHVPDPAKAAVPTGPVRTWQEVTDSWVGVDLSTSMFPRDYSENAFYRNIWSEVSAPNPYLPGVQVVRLTHNNLPASVRTPRANNNAPYVVRKEFPSWENHRLSTAQQRVRARDGRCQSYAGVGEKP